MRFLASVITCLASFSVTISSPNPNSLNSVLFSGDYEFIDLTYPFDHTTNYWKGTQGFVFTKKNEQYRSDGTWYAAKEFAAGEHGGTHIDAPYHFSKNGIYVGAIPLETLIVPLIVIDVSNQVNGNPSFVLYENHIENHLNFNIDKPSLVVFKFGWSKLYNDPKAYFGVDDNKSILNFPGLSSHVVEWVTKKYPNIVGIGVDTASVDPGYSTDFPVHKFTAAKGLYNVENVKLDRPIPNEGCTALVLPMKITEGTGAPVRLVAICPKKLTTVEFNIGV